MSHSTNPGQRPSNAGRLANYGLGAAAVSALSLVSQGVGAAIIPFSDSGSFVEGTVDDGDQPTIIINLGDGTDLQIDPSGDGSQLGIKLDNGGLWDNTGFNGNYPVPSVLGTGVDINPTDPGGGWVYKERGDGCCRYSI